MQGKLDGENLQQSVTQGNQISGYCYDAAGNLTIEGVCGPALTYTYDAENRMTATAGVTYSYDGDGRRVKKSSGKLYWYGIGSDPLVETDLSGTPSAAFVFFNGKRTARLDLPGAAVHYYFSDRLGSASVVTNATGTTIEEESDYYPWGRERVITDLLPDQNYKFTGKERDTESNLDFFIARHYSSGLGRFLQPDEFTGGPVDAFSSSDPLPPGPLPYADITNPQSLNKYTYTWNNPLKYVDPEGHKELPPGSVPEGLYMGGCPPRALLCDDKKKKKGSPEVTDQDIDKGIGKAFTNELIQLQHTANAVARMAGEKNVPADTPLLQPDTPGEKLVMDTMSVLLLASAFGGGKGKAGKELLERHHRLPQEFRKIFEKLGLDLEKFTKMMTLAKHRLKPDGLHTDPLNYK